MKLADRLAAACGAATVLLLVVGGDVLGTPPGPQTTHPTGQQYLDNFTGSQYPLGTGRYRAERLSRRSDSRS